MTAFDSGVRRWWVPWPARPMGLTAADATGHAGSSRAYGHADPEGGERRRCRPASLGGWRPWGAGLLLLLAGCAAIKPVPSLRTEWTTAALLNQRYARTDAACDTKPAYYCSGVMLREVATSPQYKFWTHSPAAEQLGSTTFYYLRGDSPITQVRYGAGYIFSDQQTAVAAGKSQSLRCIYPFLADTQRRPDNGCGFFDLAKTAQQADQSACQTVGVTTAPQWLANFQEHGSTQHSQCSLSTTAAPQFQAALAARALVPQWAGQANELLVATWDPAHPERLPIEAFFYTTEDKLAEARQFQRDYYAATGLYRVVVRWTLGATAPFSFIASDQVAQGQLAADLLNERYGRSVDDCAGQLPAYHCSGVLLRVTGATTAYKAWNPSPHSELIGGVPFSYLRKDLGAMSRLAWGGTQGLIVHALEVPAEHPLAVRCAYATDGDTVHRAAPGGGGCGANSSFPAASIPCDEQGIDTVEAWRLHFHAVASQGDRIRHTCSFNGDRPQFALAMAARSHFDDPGYWRDVYHNEIMVGTWPQNIPEKLPLQALFYRPDATAFREEGLAGAQFIQRDFYRTTGKFLPIVRLTLPVPSIDTPFSYVGWDQNVPESPDPSVPQITSVREFFGGAEIPDGGSTTATILIFSGTASPNQYVELLDGTSPQGTALVDGSGAWTRTLGQMSLRLHSFTARGLYGNHPVSAARTVLVEKLP